MQLRARTPAWMNPCLPRTQRISSPPGCVFYTNRTSAKAQDLAVNGYACVLFPWYALRRQVIVHGAVTPLSQADSEPYFHSRPRGSQLGAWASRQSSVIESRD